MSNLRFNGFCGAVLFVFIIQSTTILALECYGCFVDPDYPPPFSNPDCLKADPPATLLVNERDREQTLQSGLKMSMEDISKLKVKMTDGIFCLKYSEVRNGTDVIFRYVTTQAPDASVLDKSGCVLAEDGKYCFCQQDKCNNGPVDRPKETSGVSFILPSSLLLIASSLMLINRRS